MIFEVPKAMTELINQKRAVVDSGYPIRGRRYSFLAIISEEEAVAVRSSSVVNTTVAYLVHTTASQLACFVSDEVQSQDTMELDR